MVQPSPYRRQLYQDALAEIERYRSALQRAELRALKVDHTIYDSIPLLACPFCPSSILMSERHEKRVEHDVECPFRILNGG